MEVEMQALTDRIISVTNEAIILAHIPFNRSVTHGGFISASTTLCIDGRVIFTQFNKNEPVKSFTLTAEQQLANDCTPAKIIERAKKAGAVIPPAFLQKVA